MKEHLSLLNNSEKKCEQIIKLEENWYNLSLELENNKKIVGEFIFIKSSLKKTEIDIVSGLIKLLEANLEKNGFWSNIANFTAVKQLRKILKLSQFEVSYENLARLKSELDLALMNCNLLKIESDIQKIGNLHVLIEQIKQMIDIKVNPNSPTEFMYAAAELFNVLYIFGGCLIGGGIIMPSIWIPIKIHKRNTQQIKNEEQRKN